MRNENSIALRTAAERINATRQHWEGVGLLAIENLETGGTWLDQHAGASPATAQALLGHADLRTTQRYVHAGNAMARTAAERLPTLVRVLSSTGTDERAVERANWWHGVVPHGTVLETETPLAMR